MGHKILIELDPVTEKRLRRIAERDGVSISEAANRILTPAVHNIVLYAETDAGNGVLSRDQGGRFDK